MDFLTRESVERGYKPQVPQGKVFTEAFLREVRLWGRAYELGLMAELKLRTFDILSDMDLAVKMVGRNKLGYSPTLAHHPKKAKPLPGAADALAYYPGCSLHSTAAEYNHSAEAVCAALDLELVEPHGWLRDRLGDTCQLVEISSIYGHDAFLKETEVLRDVFARALDGA